MLTNSGAESVEAAIKLARAATERPRILYCEHAFHGLTLGALSVNGNPEFRERFGPLLPGCDAIPFGDLDVLRRELEAEDVAAFLVEPIQGKTVRIPDASYLPSAQELCRRHGALFAVDEVQTGLGRTGRFLALEHWSLEPDVVTVSKALSGGYVPVGAVLATRAVFDRVFDSMERSVVHGSTFGTNDLAAAAGIATLAELDEAGLIEHARRMGDLLLELTTPFVERFEIVREVRGLGLLWAIELGDPASNPYSSRRSSRKHHQGDSAAGDRRSGRTRICRCLASGDRARRAPAACDDAVRVLDGARRHQGPTREPAFRAVSG